VAPGTAGAGVGVLVFVLLAPMGLPLFGLTVVALWALGVLVSDHAEVFFGKHDDGRIVVDEVVGQLVALTPLVGGLGREAISLTSGAGIVGLVTGFVAFRLFDIWKPGPVRWAERRFAGGAGVMADDVVAGVLGAAALVLLEWGWRAAGGVV
jgi:phosphatidylglycerophosphatase A